MTKLFIIISLFITNALFANISADKNAVIANVNGTKITLSDFIQAYEQNKLFVSNKKVTKTSVLNDLINRELGIQKAKKLKLDNNPIVKRKMNDVMFHAQVSKDLEPLLKKINIKDSDVKSYYKRNKEYRTAHILFRMLATPKKKEVQAAIKQSLAVYQELKKNPEKFHELSAKFSQSNTAPNGGDMGFQPANVLAPEYFNAIKNKKSGFISPPIRTAFGFHIIKVLAVKDFKEINLAYYKKIVYDIQRDKIMSKYFKTMRKQAKISIEKKHLK